METAREALDKVWMVVQHVCKAMGNDLQIDEMLQ
jgi:hypothetical protein